MDDLKSEMERLGKEEGLRAAYAQAKGAVETLTAEVEARTRERNDLREELDEAIEKRRGVQQGNTELQAILLWVSQQWQFKLLPASVKARVREVISF